MDSKTAIYTIDAVLYKKPHQLIDCNNFLILQKICRLVQEGKLNLTLHKVKRYSGDYRNEKVDVLAKDALYAPSVPF